MKKIFTLALFCSLFVAHQSHAQKRKIKAKNNIVTVDGVECLKYNSDMMGTTYSSLDGKELVFVSHHLKTDTNPAYDKIIFLQEKKMMTNQQITFTKKILVNQLINNKILVDCKWNPEAIDIFILKFHEEIPVYTKVNVEMETD